jgi:hypothetical protein
MRKILKGLLAILTAKLEEIPVGYQDEFGFHPGAPAWSFEI